MSGPCQAQGDPSPAPRSSLERGRHLQKAALPVVMPSSAVKMPEFSKTALPEPPSPHLQRAVMVPGSQSSNGVGQESRVMMGDKQALQ